MILDLDENFRVLSDEYNFILQKRTDPKRGPNTRKGKKLNKTGGWKDVGYWKDLGQLLLSYSRQKLRASRGNQHGGGLSPPGNSQGRNQGHWEAMCDPLGQDTGRKKGRRRITHA